MIAKDLNRFSPRSSGNTLLLALAAWVLSTPVVGAQDRWLAIRGESVYTMTEETPLVDGVVLVRNDKIEAVGPSDQIEVPTEARVLSAPVITPGWIDAHATVGMSGLLNQPQDQEQIEDSAPIQPELRAIDAYNARDPLVEWVRGFGVTTVHTGHGPGALISGQTMIVKTHLRRGAPVVIRPFAAVAGALGDAPLRSGSASPGTRAKSVALLRESLLEAQRYIEAQEQAEPGEEPERDLRKEAMAEVLSGETPLLITAHRAHDITAALRLQEEFGFDLLLDGASEAYRVLDLLVESKVGVIAHPTMQRPAGERQNAVVDLSRRLHGAGVPFAFQSGFEAYVPKTRVVLFEAAMSVPYGLDRDAALRALTIEAARLLKIDQRVGSLAPGKDADLALFQGDPFEYTSKCVNVVIDGVVYSGEED